MYVGNDGTSGKNLPAIAGDIRDMGSIPGSGRSPGGGHGKPLQLSSGESPWTEEPDSLQSMGLQRVRHDIATNTHTHIKFNVLL